MATPHRAAAGQPVACPICGALESTAACNDSHKNTAAVTRIKGDATGRIPAEDSSAVNPTRMLLVGLEALDLLGVGLVVCNVFGQLLVANQTAEKFLASRDGLELNADRVLCAVSPCSPRIEELVQRAASAVLDRSIGTKDAALSVPRPSNRRPLTLLVRSVTSPSKTVNAALPAALVLIVDSGLSVQAIVLELQQLYGFTSTEARLANLLMEGEALEDCCDQLGICRSTGCTHLKRIFKKTGVRRQSELVALLLRSIGLARLAAAGTTVAAQSGTSPLRQPMNKDTRGVRASCLV